jgi:hypothetical protein
MREYEYDVAFSFLAKDEPYARRLAVLIGGQARTFVYSDHQKDLAGKDGMEEFTKTFAERARVVVVLHREGWGDHKWTGVERTAIKERGFEHGWEFLLAISLDGTAPVGIPKAQLWLDWKRFGEETAVAVILRKVTEQGGDVHEESAAEQAARAQSQHVAEKNVSGFLHSERGVAAALAALAEMHAHLAVQVDAMRTTASALRIDFEKDPHAWKMAISSPGYTVTMAWSHQYSNSLDGSSLFIVERAGLYHLGPHWRGEPTVKREVHVSFTVDADKSPKWIEDDKKQRFSPVQFAERYLKRVVERAGNEPELDNDERHLYRR